MTKKLMQVTTPTFDSTRGIMLPVGSQIVVDMADEEAASASNVREPSNEPVPAAIVIAAIAPTGPNPGMPQQLPPGAVGTFAGYTDALGTPLVAEGSVAAAEAASANATADSGVEVEEGGEPAVKGPLDGSIPDLVAHLATVTDTAELDKLRDAETQGKTRAGALAAIDARKAELVNPLA